MATEPETLSNGLPKTHRYITSHNSSGEAVFSNTIPSAQPFQPIGEIATFALNYTTSEYPVSFESEKDVSSYAKYLESPPGLVIPGGSVLRVVDCAPGTISPMHRTVSLDYGVVLEGEVWLELDSGEKRLMRRGDVSIQRGTNHAWRNNSKDTWARMLYVLLESKPIEVGGKPLGEDYGNMPEEVRKSG